MRLPQAQLQTWAVLKETQYAEQAVGWPLPLYSVLGVTLQKGKWMSEFQFRGLEEAVPFYTRN